MELPDLYRKAGILNKKHAMVYLEEFTGNKKWKENARILDVGCGDGSTNKDVLQKFVPRFRQIVGCDVSKKMIDYAKIHYGSERVDFLLWDVSLKPPQALEPLLGHLITCFHFTFYTGSKNKTAFMNIYNTMAEGGNCLLVFLGRSDVHDTFVKLSKTEKWREDLMDVGKFISPYFHSQDPGSEVTNLMKKVGFKEVQVKVQETVYTYESMDALGSTIVLLAGTNNILLSTTGHRRSTKSTFVTACGTIVPYKTEHDLVKALNPFNVLNEKWEEFMTDYFKTSPSPLTVHRKLIVAYGAKY